MESLLSLRKGLTRSPAKENTSLDIAFRWPMWGRAHCQSGADGTPTIILVSTKGVVRKPRSERIDPWAKRDAMWEVDGQPSLEVSPMIIGSKQMAFGRSLSTVNWVLVLGLLSTYQRESLRAIQSQTGSPRATFEVASVKPCSTASSTYAGRAGLKTMEVNCLPLDLIIRNAYLLYADGAMNRRSQNTRIEGGPGWISSERYSIGAKTATEVPPGLMQGEMMRSLLEERFKLKVRHETRMLPVFKLAVSSRGLQVPKAKEACFSPGMSEPPLTPPGHSLPPRCGDPKFVPGGMNL